MRIPRQAAPADFEQRVGEKGAAALNKHNPRTPVRGEFWKGREYWRNALDQLCDSYERLCAFTAIRIERVTGSPTVEHFKPKAKYPELAYQWENFRLVCGLMNGRKGDFEDVLDPFELPDNVFDLNPLSGEIVVHGDCPESFKGRAQATIDRLKLSDPECNFLRQDHVQKLATGAWSFEETRRQSPFVVACLVRQGLIALP